MRLVALGGVLGPVLFTTVVIICSALRPDYSHLNGFISELGATGTTHAALMNLAGFIPAGALIAGFGVTLHQVSSGLRSIFASSLITFFGCGMAFAGIFSCDPGCPQPPTSLAGTIHDRVSVATFLAGIAGIGVWALEFRARPSLSDLWKYTALTSAAGLVFLLALGGSLDSRALTGLWQRLLVGTLFVWYGVVALRLVHYPTRAVHNGSQSYAA